MINDINRELYFLKLSVDLSDGEILGEADLCLEDQMLSEAQLFTHLHNVLVGLDMATSRLNRIVNREDNRDQESVMNSAKEHLHIKLRQLMKALIEKQLVDETVH